MTQNKKYFLCGIGGSGMLPLAMLLKARGADVTGSDRALDQGRTSEKFDFLRDYGIELFPQDGSGLMSREQTIIASAAIEDTVPDIAAALKNGSTRVTRAEALADLFNGADTRIGVAGTSGKSTTTAMIAWILHAGGHAPTVMNGAVMKNFVTADNPFASARAGDGPAFVSELDESDGSIALFTPDIAVLNNISLDHKSMDELRALFSDFLAKARTPILNLDNDETRELLPSVRDTALTYTLEPDRWAVGAALTAEAITPAAFGIHFEAVSKTARTPVDLKMPGRHNVSNALAAILAAHAAGMSIEAAATALNDFTGVKRRFEFVGTSNGKTVIDDFGHNPDKIAATLRTLKAFDGRLLVMFQPHGYGPLRKFGTELITTFVENLSGDDRLFMPEPVYFGGTVDRSSNSADLVFEIKRQGINADAFETRIAAGDAIVSAASPGDRIIVMGARDDTLSEFAADLLERL
ncbi:MAG: Mur ligase family protein [Pseudomonadota bacterium]